MSFLTTPDGRSADCDTLFNMRQVSDYEPANLDQWGWL